MSTAELPAARPPAWPMYRALVGVGMFCGLVIALVYEGTRPVIEQNRAEALERAIFAVLPAATARRTYSITADSKLVVDPSASGDRVHAGFDDTGSLVGFAIEAAGMGYADTISVLYGYAPASETIVGFQVLASKETPGLGDKIETDPLFLENFVALDVALDPERGTLANRVVTVKSGTKSEDWQVDGITGATISSVAIGDIIAASAERWLPVINRELDAVRPGEGNDES